MKSPSFDDYHERYHQLIFRNFLCRVGSASEAEDLTQDTFLGAARGFPEDGSQPPLAWVLRIADNVFKNWLRHRSAAKRDGIEHTYEDYHEDDGQNQETHLITKQEIRAMGLAIEALPDRMKHCFKLYYLQEYKYHEIALMLDINIQTVKSQLNRGRKKVVDSLNSRHIIN